MSAIDPSEIPLLLSTDNEGQEAPSKGPNLTPSDRALAPRKSPRGARAHRGAHKKPCRLIILAIFVLVARLATVLFRPPLTITALGSSHPRPTTCSDDPKGQDVLALTSGARA